MAVLCWCRPGRRSQKTCGGGGDLWAVAGARGRSSPRWIPGPPRSRPAVAHSLVRRAPARLGPLSPTRPPLSDHTRVARSRQCGRACTGQAGVGICAVQRVCGGWPPWPRCCCPRAVWPLASRGARFDRARHARCCGRAGTGSGTLGAPPGLGGQGHGPPWPPCCGGPLRGRTWAARAAGDPSPGRGSTAWGYNVSLCPTRGLRSLCGGEGEGVWCGLSAPGGGRTRGGGGMGGHGGGGEGHGG